MRYDDDPDFGEIPPGDYQVGNLVPLDKGRRRSKKNGPPIGFIWPKPDAPTAAKKRTRVKKKK